MAYWLDIAELQYDKILAVECRGTELWLEGGTGIELWLEGGTGIELWLEGGTGTELWLGGYGY